MFLRIRLFLNWYADFKDLILMIVGLTASVCHGIMLPTMSLFFGGLANVFISQQKYRNDPRYFSNISIDTDYFASYSTMVTSNAEDGFPPDFITEHYFYDIVDRYSLYFVYIGIVMFTSALTQACTWETACANQICKLRQIYFAQTLRQDLAWYDESDDGDLTSKLTDDMERMRDGLGSKVPLLTQAFTTLIAGMVIGFITSWRLSLVIVAGGPVILVASAVNAKISRESAIREQVRYGIAGGIASEILNSIRTVAAFSTQTVVIKRFEVALIEGKNATLKRYRYLSGALGISIGFLYFMYGIGVWYGSHLFLNDEITPGQIFTVFMSIITGAFGIGNSLPLLTEISNAFGAASNVFSIIDNVPSIDPYSNEGQALEKIDGKIEFNNVYFCYSSRPNVMVLSGLDFVIQPGQIVALVGASGSGKSTVINLLLRFYDPLCGKILIDNVNIKDMNVGSLRRNLGVVSQEPVLFDVTIEENIRFGNADATDFEIRTAAKLANADDFIRNMPLGYNTMVGERGVQLSGGQKQRIAIARALVSNPKILLLDEATSALDSRSEAIVQAALDNAMSGRTTIIVAHRLSTIKNANLICAMKKGRIVESGTHDELMQLKGVYYSLVLTQSKNGDDANIGEQEPQKTIKRYSVRRKSSRRKSTGSKGTKTSDNKSFEEVEAEDLKFGYFDLLRLNTDKCLLVATIIACIISGFHIPSFAMLYGGILKIFLLTGDDFYSAVIFYSGLFCLLALVSTLALMTAVLTSSIGTENMIKELRLNLFKNFLSQEISLFDEDDYSPIRLINLLSRDPPLIKCVVGMRAGYIIVSTTTLVLSLVIIFYFGWRLALALVVFIPLLVYGNWKQGKMRFSSFIKESAATEQAAKLASECLQNIKTLQSLCLQEHMVNLFADKLSIAHKDEKKHGYIYGFTYAFSTSLVFFMYACTFRVGAIFISEEYITAPDMYRILFSVAFTATTIGAATVFFLDFNKGKLSIQNCLKLVHMKTKLDPFSNEGLRPEIKGKIQFKDVWFSYPARRNQKILRGLDLTIEPGQTLALVGGSGSGKSTIISLLERFYLPDRGSIILDGIDIADINIGHLRNNLGIVTQEPTLFNTTIKENIEYGALSLEQKITEQDVIQAAKASNIHEFIVSIPQGYETKVGDRGSKLSGGQKQRVAIARALIRNPKILLLDEATSALDTESEKIVQEALDKAREGRTCIIIAHRLSTIQNADKIAVIHNGIVEEQGTHEELKAMGGLYYDLIKNQ
ncbi:ATP-dependent translocase ABCB1-like isoform X2 [Rhodnius prolixus]|uniref:ATP-dependent translocase ABCB1-like isoform X2 n=1 Tax=Rhodnius prolixus TaxID=13249 RepID=UPI003D18E7F6